MISRKLGEKIVINDDLYIFPVRIDYKYERVKLAFEGSRTKWLIDRYEINERKKGNFLQYCPRCKLDLFRERQMDDETIAAHQE